MRVDTGATILARIRLALLHVLGAGVTRKARRTITAESAAAGQCGTGAAIATG